MKLAISLIIALIAFVVSSPQLSAEVAQRDVFNYEAQSKAPAGTRRIVFISANGTHGGRGYHEFLPGATYLARRINAEYPNAFAVVYPQSQWPKDLSKADAIIVLLNQADKAANDPNIKAAVERGAGFAAIHFGVEVSKGEPGDNYLHWMGGYFEQFWSVNPTWEANVTIIGEHPVARGVKPFTMKDEWYYHMRFREGMKGVTPILSAIAPVKTVHFKEGGQPSSRGGNGDVFKAVEAGEPQHLAWVAERPDGGRGFGFTGFHAFANLADDSFRTTLLNGVAWVAKLEIPAKGVPSKTLTTEELEAMMDEAHGPATPAAPAPATDAKPVFSTPLMTSESKPRILDVDTPLKGAKELYLVVSDEGKPSCDWADWIEPRLIMADGSVLDLTTLKWKSATAGSGKVNIGKAAFGGPLLVDKKTYANGIGTHASSVIAFELPANVERFTAKVAIDDGGMISKGEPSNADVSFRVFTQMPEKQ
jgi:hypothetical protein